MICPDCGNALAESAPPVDTPERTIREYMCGGCAKKWYTVERVMSDADFHERATT